MKIFLLSAFLLFTGAVFAQAPMEASSDSLTFVDSSGIYYFYFNSKPVNGYYRITSSREVLTAQFKNGIVSGEYFTHTPGGALVSKFYFVDGLRHGDQYTYHPQTGKLREHFSVCYSRLHGISTHHDPEGKEAERIYHINGEKIDSEKEFNKRIKTDSCRKQVEIIRIPAETKGVVPGIIDTIKIENRVYYLSKKYPAEFFKCQDKKIDSVLFNIFSSNGKILILSASHVVEDNEIAFFYGVDSVARNRQRYFKIGDNIKRALQKKTFDDLEIIRFLEHKVFGVEKFSGMSAYMKLEEAYKK